MRGMAGRIRQQDIEEVKRRVNIADVVGEYVTLKRAGVGSLKGLSPFKEERTPSFHVRPQLGLYHCFSTGKGGDVFSFLQEMENLSFVEAVERVAQRINFELHYEEGGRSAQETSQRVRILEANRAAEAFFVGRLATPEAAAGRQFLADRGFDKAAAEHFGVGFAPEAWDALTGHLRRLGFTDEELSASGLVSAGQRGIYDRFRGRLIWPIRDVTGQTVGFGARKLLETDQGPKYLNTPDTIVYHKSQVLYGLDLARRDIGKRQQVVIVEGYTDVMAAHLAGVTTAVATCGTAFGTEHIRVIRRLLGDSSGAGEVVFTFDPDVAGQAAAMRAFAEDQRFVAQTFVAVAPDGLDPCDLRSERGDEAVRALIAAKKPLFEFALRQVLAGFNLETVEGRVAALRASAPVLEEIRDPAMRPAYVRELAGWLGVEPGEVTAAVRVGTRSTRPAHAPAAGGEPAPPVPIGLAQLPSDPTTRLERDALMAILQYPDLVPTGRFDQVLGSRFSNQTLSVIRDGIVGTPGPRDDPQWLQNVVAEVPPPYRNIVSELVMAPVPAKSRQELPSYVAGVTSALLDRDLLRLKAELLGRLQRTDQVGQPELHREIQRKLLDIERDRRAIRDN